MLIPLVKGLEPQVKAELTVPFVARSLDDPNGSAKIRKTPPTKT